MEKHRCPQCKEEKPVSKFYGRWSKKYQKYYYCWCNKCIRRKAREDYRANPTSKIEYARRYRIENEEKYKENAKRCRHKLRLDVLKMYGSTCGCCGEDEKKFLAIDHIYGGGNKHRREIGRTGQTFYQWLRLNKYPEGYRVLCHNCNNAKGFYGECPHQQASRA